MVNHKYRPLIIAFASIFALQGCATQPGQKISNTIKETFNNDDPCANSKRNIGIALGAIAGAIVATQVSGKNKGKAALIGAAAGAGLGGLVGYQFDKRACEISKIEKKYQAEIQINQIKVNSQAAANTTNAQTKSQTVGLSVNVVDKDNEPQFKSGADALNDKTREMFIEIASQYKPPIDNAQNAKDSEAFKTRRVLLIGHTDDTGSSELNADLSERRAKNVAQLFKLAGVPESQIYYQGAGETLPRADNETEEGRAKNRRVEIVDLSDEDNFSLYLQNRTANTEYYRPNDQKNYSAPTSAKTAQPVKPTLTKKQKQIEDKKQALAKPQGQTNTLKTPAIDFGGEQLTSSNSTVNLGKIAQPQSKFSFISEARASDLTRINSCNLDRPRQAGSVKSLKDDSVYATNEFLPNLNGRTWQDKVQGHLIVLNKVSVIRDGAQAITSPELNIYTNYNPTLNRNPSASIAMSPQVNTYRGSNGLVYRVFVNGTQDLQCMDILFPLDGSGQSTAGKVIYGTKGDERVAEFKPKMAR